MNVPASVQLFHKTVPHARSTELKASSVNGANHSTNELLTERCSDGSLFIDVSCFDYLKDAPYENNPNYKDGIPRLIHDRCAHQVNRSQWFRLKELYSEKTVDHFSELSSDDIFKLRSAIVRFPNTADPLHSLKMEQKAFRAAVDGDSRLLNCVDRSIIGPNYSKFNTTTNTFVGPIRFEDPEELDNYAYIRILCGDYISDRARFDRADVSIIHEDCVHLLDPKAFMASDLYPQNGCAEEWRPLTPARHQILRAAAEQFECTIYPLSAMLDYVISPNSPWSRRNTFSSDDESSEASSVHESKNTHYPNETTTSFLLSQDLATIKNATYSWYASKDKLNRLDPEPLVMSYPGPWPYQDDGDDIEQRRVLLRIFRVLSTVRSPERVCCSSRVHSSTGP